MIEILWQVFLLLMIPAIPGVTLFLYLRYSRRRISRSSIKYSIDDLPMGLTFYAEDGMVLLTNHAMNLLSETLTDAPLMNGVDFHDRLFRGVGIKGAFGGGRIDGFSLIHEDRVTDFQRKRIDVGNGVVYQLSAFDTTDLYHAEQQLRKDAKEIARAHARLKDYEREVEQLAASEAFLATKARIHDMLGQELLATRYYLTDREADISAEELVTRWEKVINDLKSGGTGKGLTQLQEDAELAASTVRALDQAAKAIGLKLTFLGDFPEQGVKLMRLIVSAARICMTNAVRHGGATEMTICFEECTDDDAMQEIVFSNNGTAPPSEMIKGGGLAALEKLMQEAEGTVEYQTDEGFAVRIKVTPAEIRRVRAHPHP